MRINDAVKINNYRHHGVTGTSEVMKKIVRFVKIAQLFSFINANKT